MVNQALKIIDVVTLDGKYIPDLIPIYNSDHTALSVDERIAINDAQSFKHIDFVLFRRYLDGRSSHVSAYIVDNFDEKLNKEALAELHMQVWLHGTTPILYVAWPSKIDVFTCARGPDFWLDSEERCHYSPVAELNLNSVGIAAEVDRELKKFSALRLVDGTFWDEPSNSKLADYDKAAHKSLIQAVVEADKELDGENNPVLRRLLLLMVLVKYLEDRQVFPNDGWFGRFHKGARTFFEVLKGGDSEEVCRLLDFFELKFNGDVFSLPRESITKESLSIFSELVETRTLNKQRYLWSQFSFEHLPVEIISHLYQRFVQGGHGAVYTPPIMASLILDYVMPYHKLTGKERILDPACGSGIFLVNALRRLINAWRNRNNWERPTVDILKSILKNSIFGIELDQNAIELTAFSLSLAICDALQPDVIWSDLKFSSLRKSNLIHEDFFAVLLAYWEGEQTIFNDRFDFIIGNPPFESKLLDAGSIVNKKAQTHNTYRGLLPDTQTAYLFLEQSLSILRDHGKIGLIQPSGLLYNYNSQAFRSNICRMYKVETILDFTSIRKMYDDADPKTIAMIACSSPPPEDHIINHWTFRRTVSVHERICFEIDHYDRHKISNSEAVSDPFVWRINLLGGGRLQGMSKSFRNMRKLGEYIEQQGEDWDFGEGYIAAKTGRREPAAFLTGKTLLPTEAFTESGIDKNKLEIVEETLFRSSYTKNRYSGPLILIRKIESLPIALIENGFIAYRNKIVGIHAPLTDIDELKNLYYVMHSKHKLFKFCCILHATESIVVRATAYYKKDICDLPYPNKLSDLELSFWEEALCEDVVEYMADYVRRGQNSDLLTKTAGINDLYKYSSLFINMLGSIYKNLKAAVPIYLNGLICQPFYFGDNPNLPCVLNKSEDDLLELLYDENNISCLRTVRVLRFYSENVLIIVKPDRLRYWIQSTAIVDADETLIDLRRQGY